MSVRTARFERCGPLLGRVCRDGSRHLNNKIKLPGAIGALEVFAREKVRIPDHLSVIGFDDVASFHLFNPPLTCIRQPVERMGRRAVEILVSGLGGARLRPAVECLPVELMLRGSVASPVRTRNTSPLKGLVDA